MTSPKSPKSMKFPGKDGTPAHGKGGKHVVPGKAKATGRAMPKKK
nr:hypothetical protein [uncultured Rhodopila sp.]